MSFSPGKTLRGSSHRSGGGISVSNHAVLRFRQRSRFPKVEAKTGNDIRRIIRQLIRSATKEPLANPALADSGKQLLKCQYRATSRETAEIYAVVGQTSIGQLPLVITFLGHDELKNGALCLPLEEASND